MARLPDDQQRRLLQQALIKLTKKDPRKAQILLLRYFAGLGTDQIAGAIDVPAQTVENEWRFIRAWLRRELKAGGAGELESRRGRRPLA